MKHHETKLDLSLKIGRLETQLCSMHETMKEIKDHLTHNRRRLDRLEKQHSFIRGSVAALLCIGTVMGAMMDHIIKWVMGR